MKEQTLVTVQLILTHHKVFLSEGKSGTV